MLSVLYKLVCKMYICTPGKGSGRRVWNVYVSRVCIRFPPKSSIADMINHIAKHFHRRSRWLSFRGVAPYCPRKYDPSTA